MGLRGLRVYAGWRFKRFKRFKQLVLYLACGTLLRVEMELSRKNRENLFFLFFFFLAFALLAGVVRAANLSTEQQLDVLAARIAANENAYFNETNETGIVFDKLVRGPYRTVFLYIAVFEPRGKPWQEIFEVNTERSIAGLDKTNVSNGFSLYIALPPEACLGCYSGAGAQIPTKFKALFYCPKTRGREYPSYSVYWEGSIFTPDYNAVIDALTRSCLDAQDEIARLETIAPSPSLASSPTPVPSLAPSLLPLPSPSPSPSVEPSPATVSNESNETNNTVTVFAEPAPQAGAQTGLIAAGAIGEDEQSLTYSALALVAGLLCVTAFYAFQNRRRGKTSSARGGSGSGSGSAARDARKK